MSLAEIEAEYGKRPRIPMLHSEPLQTHHFRAELDDGQRFVYCPVGAIISWSPGDYDAKWCEWCRIFWGENNE